MSPFMNFNLTQKSVNNERKPIGCDPYINSGICNDIFDGNKKEELHFNYNELSGNHVSVVKECTCKIWNPYGKFRREGRCFTCFGEFYNKKSQALNLLNSWNDWNDDTINRKDTPSAFGKNILDKKNKVEKLICGNRRKIDMKHNDVQENVDEFFNKKDLSQDFLMKYPNYAMNKCTFNLKDTQTKIGSMHDTTDVQINKSVIGDEEKEKEQKEEEEWKKNLVKKELGGISLNYKNCLSFVNLQDMQRNRSVSLEVPRHEVLGNYGVTNYNKSENMGPIKQKPEEENTEISMLMNGNRMIHNISNNKNKSFILNNSVDESNEFKGIEHMDNLKKTSVMTRLGYGDRYMNHGYNMENNEALNQRFRLDEMKRSSMVSTQTHLDQETNLERNSIHRYHHNGTNANTMNNHMGLYIHEEENYRKETLNRNGTIYNISQSADRNDSVRTTYNNAAVCDSFYFINNIKDVGMNSSNKDRRSVSFMKNGIKDKLRTSISISESLTKSNERTKSMDHDYKYDLIKDEKIEKIFYENHRKDTLIDDTDYKNSLREIIRGESKKSMQVDVHREDTNTTTVNNLNNKVKEEYAPYKNNKMTPLHFMNNEVLHYAKDNSTNDNFPIHLEDIKLNTIEEKGGDEPDQEQMFDPKYSDETRKIENRSRTSPSQIYGTIREMTKYSPPSKISGPTDIFLLNEYTHLIHDKKTVLSDGLHISAINNDVRNSVYSNGMYSTEEDPSVIDSIHQQDTKEIVSSQDFKGIGDLKHSTFTSVAMAPLFACMDSKNEKSLEDFLKGPIPEENQEDMNMILIEGKESQAKKIVRFTKEVNKNSVVDNLKDDENEMINFQRPDRRWITLPGNKTKTTEIQNALHVNGQCKPCAFYYNKKKGCRNGDFCEFCHHEDHASLSLKQWKKQQKRMMKLGLLSIDKSVKYDSGLPSKEISNVTEQGFLTNISSVILNNSNRKSRSLHNMNNSLMNRNNNIGQINRNNKYKNYKSTVVMHGGINEMNRNVEYAMKNEMLHNEMLSKNHMPGNNTGFSDIASNENSFNGINKLNTNCSANSYISNNIHNNNNNKENMNNKINPLIMNTSGLTNHFCNTSDSNNLIYSREYDHSFSLRRERDRIHSFPKGDIQNKNAIINNNTPYSLNRINPMSAGLSRNMSEIEKMNNSKSNNSNINIMNSVEEMNKILHQNNEETCRGNSKDPFMLREQVSEEYKVFHSMKDLQKEENEVINNHIYEPNAYEKYKNNFNLKCNSVFSENFKRDKTSVNWREELIKVHKN